MALLCDSLKTIIILPTKTASTSIADYFIKNHDAVWIPRKPRHGFSGGVKLCSKHTKLSELLRYKLISESDLDKYDVLTLCRNPFDHVLSVYRYYNWLSNHYAREIYNSEKYGYHIYYGYSLLKYSLSLKTLRVPALWVLPFIHYMKQFDTTSFASYVKTRFLNVQDSVIKKYIIGAKKVHHLKFENINKDLNTFLEMKGCSPTADLQHINQTSHYSGNYRSYYDEESKKIIEQAFAYDLTTFQYEF